MFADGGLGFFGYVFQLVIHDEKEQVALIGSIDKNRAQTDAGTDSNFAGRRIVKSLRDEQLARRILDATQFVDLVPLPLPEWTRELSLALPFCVGSIRSIQFHVIWQRSITTFLGERALTGF